MRIVVVGLEEAATKQEGGDEEEDQNREPTAPWPGSCFLLYLFYINACWHELSFDSIRLSLCKATLEIIEQ